MAASAPIVQPAPRTKRSTPTLEVKDLRVEFATRRGTLVAVNGVSFHIGEGEVLGVVGRSGAGKSLTGAAVIGLLEPPGRIAQGEVLLDGSGSTTCPTSGCAGCAASGSAWSSRTR